MNERTLMRLIEAASAEYLAEKGYTASTDAMCSEEVFMQSLIGASLPTEEESAQMSSMSEDKSVFAAPQNASMAKFAEEAFLPCFMSKTEGHAVHLLADALSNVVDAEKVPDVINVSYRKTYGSALPSDVNKGIEEYVKNRGELSMSDWNAHAAAFRAAFQPKAWKTAAAGHAQLWAKAVGADGSKSWSAFFHALHSMAALASESQVSHQFVQHMTAGGFVNRHSIKALSTSLEAERAEFASTRDTQRLFDASVGILKQAKLSVEAVGDKDVAALCSI